MWKFRFDLTDYRSGVGASARPVVAIVAKRFDESLRDRRAAGRGIPVWPDDAHVFSKLDPVPVNYELIALHLGCNAGDISQNDRNHACVINAIDELGTEIGGIEPRKRVERQPRAGSAVVRQRDNLYRDVLGYFL